ncbi:MAG: ATP-dependent metallopeptidase FtsH/Yme1/Tma family protein [Syntrophomonadaceae bacterium]
MRSKRTREDILAFVFGVSLLIILIAPNSVLIKQFLGKVMNPDYLNPLNVTIFVIASVFISTFTMGMLERRRQNIFNVFKERNTGKQARTLKRNQKAPKRNNSMPSKAVFSEVAGLTEPKRELGEVLDFLKTPEKYLLLGARIPRGIIMYGPPGTGKTLLAKALAREAEVEFVAASGSEFVEKYVGMGASRVRELFEKARQYKDGAIIFIDEIDCLGRKREGGENSIEKDQTLNQLLVEMDGFSSRNDPVIVIGSTNRLDILDPALLRPGRFDRHIAIGYPSFKERLEILQMHVQNKPIKDISLEAFAYKTSGMTGADLENICNEAAIIAARRNANFISEHDVNEAIDRIIAGIENRSYIPSLKETTRVAYHESGHALAGMLLNGEPVRRISILPRGTALGFTIQTEESDKRLYTKQEILDRMVILMAGRAAEEIIFNEVTSGAANDIEKATHMAFKMITELGMADSNISNLSYITNTDPKFVHDEVEKTLRQCLDRAKVLLTAHREKLVGIAEELLRRESLNEEDLKRYYGTG